MKRLVLPILPVDNLVDTRGKALVKRILSSIKKIHAQLSNHRVQAGIREPRVTLKKALLFQRFIHIVVLENQFHILLGLFVGRMPPNLSRRWGRHYMRQEPVSDRYRRPSTDSSDIALHRGYSPQYYTDRRLPNLPLCPA